MVWCCNCTINTLLFNGGSDNHIVVVRRRYMSCIFARFGGTCVFFACTPLPGFERIWIDQSISKPAGKRETALLINLDLPGYL